MTARWYHDGQWSTPQDTAFVNLSGLSASPASRSLSATDVPNSNNCQVLVLFEETGGNVAALLGSKILPNCATGDQRVYQDPWTWENISSKLYLSSPNIIFSTPFTSGLGPAIGSLSTGYSLSTWFWDPRAEDDTHSWLINGSFSCKR